MRKTLTKIGLWGAVLIVLDITLGTLILTYVDVEAFAREHAAAVLSAPFVLWTGKRLYRHFSPSAMFAKRASAMEV